LVIFLSVDEDNMMMVKGKAIPLQAWRGLEVSRRLIIPDFIQFYWWW
jgi:hypothetical protein